MAAAVTTILVDHNMQGQAALLWSMLSAEGWMVLLGLELATFAMVGLPVTTPDRDVWRFAQPRRMLLLTNNRKATGENSLERTIVEEVTAESLPVLTIGNLDRIAEREYRERCAVRRAEIVLDLHRYLGTGRIFIP